MTEVECQKHDWEFRKQMVFGERENINSPPFRGSHAYFVKKKCKNCGKELLVDYKVEMT